MKWDKYSTIELSNGLKLPIIGFGTALMQNDTCVYAVDEAIKQGYRLIDTASQYKNEEPVGKSVRECGISRSKLFVSSKLWNKDHGYENTIRAFEESLKWMGLDYLDLYLIHWPNPKDLRNIGYEKHNSDSWRAMEELYEAGKVRAIGVSNFLPHHLEALIKHAKIKPMINQICLYPGHVDKETVEFCRKKHIILQAYSPLGAGKLLSNSVIIYLAQKYNRTPAQICLRWHLQNGFIPLPKSVNGERIKSNIDIFDFELSNDEMDILSNLKTELHLLPNPDEAEF